MYLATVIHFCILYSYVFGQYESSMEPSSGESSSSDDYHEGLSAPAGGKKALKGNGRLNIKQYQAELAAADNSEFLGSNAHYEDPRYFKNLNRRFIPVYPYKFKAKPVKDGPEEIFKYIQWPKKGKNIEDEDVIPIRAPSELVLAVMKKAKKMAVSNPKPSDPTEEVIRQYMLRSGDYWNDVVKEEVDPDFILRTKTDHKPGKRDEELFRDSQPISAKLRPGTKLYNLIAEIVKKVPKLVYIINDK